MADYSKGKIYRIVGGDDVYIGSTTRSLATRWAEHKYDSIHKQVCSSIILNKHGIDNCQIELIEEYPCESVNELRRREAEVIRDTPCVNHQIPGRTAKEWYSDMPVEMRREMGRIQTERRRDTRGKKHECECGGQYTTSNKKVHEATNKHVNYLSSK
jgi:hypothetical protein